MTQYLYWDNLNTVEFAARDMARTIAVLPLAATEQHGPHLPVAVDAIINAGIVEAMLASAPTDSPVLVLPAQNIGMSEEHDRFSGTLSLSAETLIAAWTEIGAATARAGVRKLVIFNSHGGNPPVMDIVARRLRGRHAMLAVTANWYDLAIVDDLFNATERRHGVHGGAVETSMMLHLRPDLVDMTKACNFASLGQTMETNFPVLSPTGRPSFAWETQDLNETGAVGDATAADAAIGKIIVQRAADGLIALLQDVENFDLAALKIPVQDS
ncbi:MAG: creatininase family protein [Rhodospirillaceae bacterium]|jgi:creatinine amidohydrolase|nr:creatininase family protein [Rhodospirillaceae bacterium]MBT5666501.1 creatininase family protein [Rhodospirillaceae bacterium]